MYLKRDNIVMININAILYVITNVITILFPTTMIHKFH